MRAGVVGFIIVSFLFFAWALMRSAAIGDRQAPHVCRSCGTCVRGEDVIWDGRDVPFCSHGCALRE